MDPVPTIDLGLFVDGTPRERNAVARALDDACRHLGFLQLVGHGIGSEVALAMRRESALFFALPLEQKLSASPPRRGLRRGYRALGRAAPPAGRGPSRRDALEAFDMGPDGVPDDPWHRAAPPDDFAPNVWPTALPALRAAATRYFDDAARVARSLTNVFAIALGLPERWFQAFVDPAALTLRLLDDERRPDELALDDAAPQLEAQSGAGLFTLLLSDPIPGLQLLDSGGRWCDVVPSPGTLLVQLGTLASRWTNERWRSPPHRWMPPPGPGHARRRSAGLTLDVNYDALIECIPTCQSAALPARYAPVVASEHRMQGRLGRL